MQSLNAAVIKSLYNLREQSPDTIVGIIAFNDEVHIYGDAQKEPLILDGNSFSTLDDAYNFALSVAQDFMLVPIKDSLK
jgi:hypothetical protein